MVEVAIRACGVISAHGVGFDQFARGVQEALTPFRRVNNRLGAYVEDDQAPQLLGPKGLRTLSRETRMFLAAVALAWRDLEPIDRPSPENLAIICATERAGLVEYATLFDEGRADPLHRITPARGPQTGLNAPASQAAIRFHAEGPNLTVSSGSTAGIDVLGAAIACLRSGEAEMIIGGGVDVLPVGGSDDGASALDRVVKAGTSADLAGSGRHPQPFDRSRRGSVDGEAAAALILAADEMFSGTATCRITLAGHGAAFDADPVAAGRRAVAAALDEAGVVAGTINAVICSANGDPVGDRHAAECLWALFGGRVPITAVAGSVGDTHGAAGILQTAVAISVLDPTVATLPPTAGLAWPDPDLPPLAYATRPTQLVGNHVLVLAISLPGAASAAVLRRRVP